MGKDQLTPARDTVASLVAAARAIQADPPGAPRRVEAFEKLVKQAEMFGERFGDLVLEVQDNRIEGPDGVIHDDEEDKSGPFASLLSGSGIRKLTLGSGVAREELEALAQVLSKAGQGDEDVVCGLWRAQLWAVTIEAQDDIDDREPETATSVSEIGKRLEDLRKRARQAPNSLHGSPPVGRDLVPESPPPDATAGEDAKTQSSTPDDLARRALEVVRAALWRAGTPLPPELGGKVLHELVHRALEKQDLVLSADVLDRADPTEAPAAALAAGEKLASLVSSQLVRAVPSLYAKLAGAQGEEIALSLALRVLGHLDQSGVRAAAISYPDIPASARRPIRRLLSARGAEALEAVIRLADHKSLEVAKDGLAILAVIPMEAARKTLEKFAKDPTTPRERLELVKAAYEHALSLAGKKGASGAQAAAPQAGSMNKAALSATLVANLRDMSRERRLAAANSLAKLGVDAKTFEAVDGLVSLPGFPDADDDEQKALLDALVASGGERSIKTLEGLATRTLGLPVCKLARAALDQAKKSKGAR